MSHYEENLNRMKEHHCELYEKLSSAKDMCSRFKVESEDGDLIENRNQQIMNEQAHRVMVGDALNGEHFLALVDGEDIMVLGSMYDPSHAAERFAMQFAELPKSAVLLLIGFGDGRIIRHILQGGYPVDKCIVYEPEPEVLYRAMDELELRDILSSDRLRLVLRGMNDCEAEQIIADAVPVYEWEKLCIIASPKYTELFPGDVKRAYEWYRSYQLRAQGEITAHNWHAEKELENEIMAQRWLFDCYSLDRMKQNVTESMTCIIVAAGPSLEKNIEQLRIAKGKACIIAVDAVLNYMLQNDIIPDYVCTIDPRKNMQLVEDKRLEQIPVFVSTECNYQFLNQFKSYIPIYFHTKNLFYEDIFKEQGCELIKSNGGGSVATMTFSLAVELGFRRIILVGQDLAFTNMNSHAGTGKANEGELTNFTMYQVEGYYEESVLTRSDFKIYLDWFNQIIPNLPEKYTVINATEGGAKITGTIQMPLEEAISSYCTSPIDCKGLYENTEKIWESYEDKQSLYEELSNGLKLLRRLKVQSKDAADLAERALHLLDRDIYSERELRNIEQKMDTLLSKITESALYAMMLNGIVENYMAMQKEMKNRTEDMDANAERRKLYLMLYDHMGEVHKMAEKCKILWEASLRDINNIYHFE